MEWAALEARSSSIGQWLGAHGLSGSTELPRAARRALRRHRSRELGHCQGITLAMAMLPLEVLIEELTEATRRRDGGTEDKCDAPDDDRHGFVSE